MDLEGIAPLEEQGPFPGYFIPLPYFEVSNPAKPFPRNDQVWNRYRQFIADMPERQAVNQEIMKRANNSYKAPGTPWVKRYGPPQTISAHLAIILPGQPNPKPYQLGMVLLDDTRDGPLFRKRLVTRSYRTRVERIWHPKPMFMASLAFMSSLWQTSVFELKQSMGIEARPAKSVQPSPWSLRDVPVWDPDPPKEQPIMVLGQFPTMIPPFFGPKPVSTPTQPGRPKAPTDSGPNQPTGSPTTLPLVPPGAKTQYSVKDDDKVQQKPRKALTDQEGNPLVPTWLDYMANPATHKPYIQKIHNLSKQPRKAFMRELGKHPQWRSSKATDYPPEGSIRLVGPVTITTPVGVVVLEVSYWYDPVSKKVLDEDCELVLKAVGHRLDLIKPQQARENTKLDHWKSPQDAEKNAQPREPPENSQ